MRTHHLNHIEHPTKCTLFGRRVDTRFAEFCVGCCSLLYFVLTIVAGASGRIGLAAGALSLSLLTAMIGFGRGTNAPL